jgi:hypothetical protein
MAQCLGALALLLVAAATVSASEASLAIPDLWHESAFFIIFGQKVNAGLLLLVGSFVICGTLGISLYQLYQIKQQPAHQSMLDIAESSSRPARPT